VRTSRQRLLEYIRNHRYVTVAELSDMLRMTRANARHHLTILEQQGLVRGAGERPAEQGRGRPARLYTLAEATQAHSLGALASVLLEMLASERPKEQQPGLYQQVACALKSSGSQPPPVSRSLTQRLSQTVQQLNQLNYRARWEAHAQGPRLILGHCPYAAILSHHPELCQIDRYLLQELVGAPVEQTERLALDERGAPFCRFALHTR
jgi:predicted ArsR family transcriptional regulator